MNIWNEKISLATTALEMLASGQDFRECLAFAGLTHESTGFSPAIETTEQAKVALLEYKSANQHGLINELGGYDQ